MNGSWPIYVEFLSMSAHIRRVFRWVFAGHVGPFTSGFCRVFWACGAHLRWFLWFLGLVFVDFGLGFRGFWAVSVAGKEEAAEVAVTSLLFSRFASFLCGLGTPSCQCT